MRAGPNWLVGVQEAEWWEGLLYVVLALCILAARVVFRARWYYGSVRVGMNVRMIPLGFTADFPSH